MHTAGLAKQRLSWQRRVYAPYDMMRMKKKLVVAEEEVYNKQQEEEEWLII